MAQRLTVVINFPGGEELIYTAYVPTYLASEYYEAIITLIWIFRRWNF